MAVSNAQCADKCEGSDCPEFDRKAYCVGLSKAEIRFVSKGLDGTMLDKKG